MSILMGDLNSGAGGKRAQASLAGQPAAPDASADAGPQKEKKPADPRKAKHVQAALKYASKRDPAHDVFKPLGRGAFLIWAVILIGLAVASRDIPVSAQTKALTDAWSVTAKTYTGLFGTPSQRQSALKRLERHPDEFAKVTTTTFAAGTGVFAAYYALVYLLGIPLAKTMAAAGRGLHKRIIKPALRAAERARERGRQKRLIETRQTSAGIQPKLQ